MRGVYTWSKTIDDGDSLNATTSGNEPALASNPFDLRADRGLANFDVRNVGVINATYALPFEHSNLLLKGWTLNSIVTLQGGFPFTPQLSYNPSNTGDTRNPVRPYVNPAFTGPVIRGDSEPVVQSGGISGASERERILRQPGPRHAAGTGSGDVGFFGDERHADPRKSEAAVPRGVLQYSESGEFQFAERGNLHAVGGFADCRRNYQYFDHFAANPVEPEAALVVCQPTQNEDFRAAHASKRFHAALVKTVNEIGAAFVNRC